MKQCSICKEIKALTEFHYKKSEVRHESCCKNCVYALQKNRWKARKVKAVELMGGVCCKCDYNKNYAAMHFHHLDPTQKQFDWNKLRLKKWEDIVVELKKCILLCGNCHAEMHYPDMMASNVVAECDNARLNKEIAFTGLCLVCNIEVYGTKYCSVACAGLGKRKVSRPTKEKLLELMDNFSWTAIAKKYNVSDNAVRKWARLYSLL